MNRKISRFEDEFFSRLFDLLKNGAFVRTPGCSDDDCRRLNDSMGKWVPLIVGLMVTTRESQNLEGSVRAEAMRIEECALTEAFNGNHVEVMQMLMQLYTYLTSVLSAAC